MSTETGPSAVWTRYWLALLAGLVCYVLSAGPVIGLYMRTLNPVLRQTAAVIYLPLQVFDDTPVGTALAAWVLWCCEPGQSCS